MCHITDIAAQPKIDWLSYDPDTRAWAYVEKYKHYWLNECHKRTFNWDAAHDLFGDTIVLNAPKYSARYDEIYGLAFITYMSRNLMWEVSRDYVSESRRKTKPLKIVSENDLDKRKELVDDRVSVCFEDKECLRSALANLKHHYPQAHDVFLDYVVNEYPISTLCQIHRVSRWLIRELIKDAREYLCQRL